MSHNILFITLDDLNYNSIGRYQNKSITPHIDRLIGEGKFFERAHVNVSVCQPSRQCMMTGKYPHNNGSHGFSSIDWSVETLQEILSDSGYVNGIISKVGHLEPIHKYCWDYIKELDNRRYGWGRIPENYYKFSRDFFRTADRQGGPFFLMVNSNDPHRPFAGSEQERKKYGVNTKVSRRFEPEEIEVPGFLPDIPDVRREVAEYFTSAHRADESVGQIIRALEESGHHDDTMVFFLSDNGMAFPFAKTNCYLNSTKTPLLVKWPGRVKPGSVDRDNFVTTVDFMPTILEIIEHPYDQKSFDGKSFLRLLKDEPDETPRDKAFTLFNATAMKQDFEMRCVHTKRYGYIFNEWSNGERKFRNESMTGLTFKAMQEEGKTDQAIQKRVDFCLFREKEELYDFEKDPDGLVNLAGDENHREIRERHRNYLREDMKRSGDPKLAALEELFS